MNHSAQAHAPHAAASLPEFAATFSAFAASLTADQLPAEVLAATRLNLRDTLACATAGLSAPGVGEVLDLVRSWGGAPQAGIWCTGERVPAPHAAWVNGVMAHARDYDDTHDAAVLHAGVSVIPAALAAAELRGGCSGAELVAGIAVGLELACRLGLATRIGIIESGFIYSSLFGYFGATAAAARCFAIIASRRALLAASARCARASSSSESSSTSSGGSSSGGGGGGGGGGAEGAGAAGGAAGTAVAGGGRC